jgi:hypothetical protein
LLALTSKLAAAHLQQQKMTERVEKEINRAMKDYLKNFVEPVL